MNEDVHINEDGLLIENATSSNVFLSADLLSDNEKFTADDLCARIRIPLSTGPIKQLVANLKVCMKHNFVPSLLVIAGGILSFHYQQIVQCYGGCPLTFLTGESGTGKSTAIGAFLSMIGLYDRQLFVKGTNAAFLERSSKSSLPYGIDDPNKGKQVLSKSNIVDLGELAVDLYKGARTANMRTGSMKPLSIPIVATNFGPDVLDRCAMK